MSTPDGPGARGSQNHARPGHLTLDPSVAPGGVLPGQSEDDRHRAGGDARSTWAVGIDPFPSDQVPVPADQSLGLDEEPSATAPFKEPTQPGEQSSIRWAQGWAVHLATQDGALMTEHDYFARQILAVMSTEARCGSSFRTLRGQSQRVSVRLRLQQEPRPLPFLRDSDD